MNKKIATLVAAAAICAPAFAQPVSVLFVGNSYTFGRVDPVMSYNTAGVDDMTRPRPDLPDPNFTDTDRHARVGAAPVGRRAGHLQAAHRAGRPGVRRCRCRRATPRRCAATS